MFTPDDTTYYEIREKSLQQWLTEMEQHPDVAVRCGIPLARGYLQDLQKKNEQLAQMCATKNRYLKQLKEKQKQDRLIECVSQKLEKDLNCQAYIKRIQEADFGCEELTSGSQVMVDVELWMTEDTADALNLTARQQTAQLESVSGRILVCIQLELPDSWMIQNHLEESDYVSEDLYHQIRDFCNRIQVTF